MIGLKKQEVLEFFGNGTLTAEAIGISPSAVSMWSDELGQEITLKVLGAALLYSRQLNKTIPKHWLFVDKAWIKPTRIKR